MIITQSLSVAYQDRLVLHQLSLTVEKGEILVVVGPNGAGKSTLVRAVSGVVSPRAGKIWVDGRDLSRLSPTWRARLMAVVPQARQLPAAFTVYQTVLLGRTPYLSWLGNAGQRDHAAALLALERTHLSELAVRRVGELSGGEQQRVLLARALAQESPILLMDEPTTHLDLHHQSSLLNLVRTLARKQNLTVLMVLHDLNLASLYADRIALLAQGRLFAMGKAAEVLTAENLSAVYGVPVSVIPHPEYGTPLVLPDGRANALEISGHVSVSDAA